jgi:hypothetical protein
VHEAGDLTIKIAFSAAKQETVQSAFDHASMWIEIDGTVRSIPFAATAEEPITLEGMTAGLHELRMAVRHAGSTVPFCDQSTQTAAFSVVPKPPAYRPMLWYTPRTGGTFNQLDS